MFDIPLRAHKDTLLLPLARLIPPSITPNHLTLTAFLAGLLSCLLASQSKTHTSSSLALTLWLLNRLLDSLDGTLARHRNTASALGGFLDLLGDFIIYSLLPIAIAYPQLESQSQSQDTWLVIALLEASFHVNNFILFYGAAVAAERQDAELTSVAMRPALVEGMESGVLFTAMLVWPAYVGFLAWVMVVGVAVGIGTRAWAVGWLLARREVEER